MSSFLSRILVAAVGLPLVVGMLWLGGWWLFVLIAPAALIALHEFYGMTRNLRPLVLAGYLGTLLALLGAQIGGLTWMLGGFMATLALAFLLKGLAETKQPTTVSVGTTILGAGWIGLGLGHVVLLRDISEHAQLASITVVLAVFASDTAAYVTGRLFGRHKLAPFTSPGKTWEGFIGGSIVAVLVPFFAFYRTDFLNVAQSLFVGAVIAFASPLGDLFESALKRDMQVKDTGKLLAGHGGMLDRIDAQLFAVVASFYVIAALGYT
ncbi:MAG TPA: phosphatidate cytidylyltransferase [Gaiellaceae bacterium]|nr:phosphatidate cytidylyltransferase [Gaiellaceae bacterium]